MDSALALDTQVTQVRIISEKTILFFKDLGLYSWTYLELRVAKLVTTFLEIWVFPLMIKEKILVKKKIYSESILTLKRGLNC